MIFYFFQNFICQSPKQFQLPSIPENVSHIINNLNVPRYKIHTRDKLIIEFISLHAVLIVSEKFN